MVIARAASLRSSFRATCNRSVTTRPRSFRQIFRRGYATSTHETPNYGGDALWAAGAVVVTIPSCWYLLSNRTHNHHEHEHNNSHEDQSNEDVDERDEEKEKYEAESTESQGDESNESTGDDDKITVKATENEEHATEESVTSEIRQEEGDNQGSKSAPLEPDCHCDTTVKEQDHLPKSDSKEIVGDNVTIAETKNNNSNEAANQSIIDKA